MVKQVEASSSSSSNSTLCPQSSDYFVQNVSLDGEILDNNSSNGEFDWNIGAQGGLLASYYYGYIWTQAVGPQLATKVGYKRVWLYAMLFASLLTFLGKYMLYWCNSIWLAKNIGKYYEWFWSSRVKILDLSRVAEGHK